MTGDREHQVVMVGRHRIDVGAEQAPEGRELVGRLFVRAVGRRQDAPTVDEKLRKARIRAGIFSTGDRVCRNEMHGFGQMRCHIADHRTLDRADIGHDRAGCEMRADLLRNAAAGADRYADNNEVGAFDRGGVGLHHLISNAKLRDALARLRRARGRNNRPRGALRTGSARDRRSDQADADQRQPVEQGGGLAHAAFPRNSLSACTTSLLASSVPTLIRKAFGSLETPTWPRISPRLVRKASASFAVRPLVSGKWISTKFAALGVTGRPSLPISSVSHASQRVLCARDFSTCAVSRIAAIPAAIAGPLTLNGPRMRLIASTTCAGPYIQPSRSAASP